MVPRPYVSLPILRPDHDSCSFARRRAPAGGARPPLSPPSARRTPRHEYEPGSLLFVVQRLDPYATSAARAMAILTRAGARRPYSRRRHP